MAKTDKTFPITMDIARMFVTQCQETINKIAAEIDGLEERKEWLSEFNALYTDATLRVLSSIIGASALDPNRQLEIATQSLAAFRTKLDLYTQRDKEHTLRSGG